MYEQLTTDDEFEELVGKADPFARGTSREVYAVPRDELIVVKKLNQPFPMGNMIEWAVWNAVKDSSFRDLFGRCLAVSKSGRFLVMEKLADIDWSTARAPVLPHWVTDRKPDAFGRCADGKIKLRDYGWIKLEAVLVPYEASFLVRSD